jgi:hypothetical protein
MLPVEKHSSEDLKGSRSPSEPRLLARESAQASVSLHFQLLDTPAWALLPFPSLEALPYTFYSAFPPKIEL